KAAGAGARRNPFVRRARRARARRSAGVGLVYAAPDRPCGRGAGLGALKRRSNPRSTEDLDMNIEELLREAFLIDEPQRATTAIDEARRRIATEGKTGGFSLEVVVPDDPDEQWLHDHVLRPLVYFCESTGLSAPNCAGVFLSFFTRNRLYCVLGAEVL